MRNEELQEMFSFRPKGGIGEENRQKARMMSCVHDLAKILNLTVPDGPKKDRMFYYLNQVGRRTFDALDEEEEAKRDGAK